MIGNTLLLAIREIRRNLLRSFLTILGIVIGVSAVITMVTLGRGATQAVQAQIASLGTNLLQVRPGQRLGPGSGGSGAPAFREADLDAIATQVAGVAAVAPEARSGVTVVAGARNWSTSVIGTTNTWLRTGNWTLAAGRAFEDGELRAGSAVCLVGATLQRELFGGADPLGQTLRIRQFSCTVIGLLAPKGQAAMGMDQDDTVVVPLRTLQRRVTGNVNIGTLLVSLDDAADSAAVQRTLRQLLRERRKLAATDDDNFNILDTRQLAETLSGTTQLMTSLLGAVAAVSLLVGGIGIMNIMLVTVSERTQDIGIRLALGAGRRDILIQFLIEASILSFAGGVAGTLIGAGVPLYLGFLYGIDVPVSGVSVAVAFAVSVGVGLFFGLYPARKAAAMNIIDALGYT